MPGSDLRVDTRSPFRPSATPRNSVNPEKWDWVHCRAFRWRRVAHINVLEMKAALHALQWRSRRNNFCNLRTMLLCDNQAVVAVIAAAVPGSPIFTYAVSVLSAFP